MKTENRIDGKRFNKTVKLDTGLVVVGGGISGTCTAIAAARQGIKVVLVQDRPVLGGNASSEVRLWILGATSHLGNNNRWAREGGIMDEILVENLYKNKEGNPVVFDTILLDKVVAEENITLLLNTAAYDLVKEGNSIKTVYAFCSQNSTAYELSAPNFCDSSGDGIISFMAGASFRMGAESKEEFGELFAPNVAEYGELLGHSIYFYSKQAPAPVKYHAPNFALKDIKNILPKHKLIKKENKGCQFWWLEWGGRLDTIHESEDIKWELWKIVYGVWDYIKNSGEFDDVDNLDLEWVGTVPGKRESRRFEGLYMMKQQDIIEQKRFDDVIAHGGWAIDLHPADGVYSNLPSCTQYHSKGIYELPLRAYISKDIDNLFFGGRIISASHVAFGTTRVMATAGLGGQAIGIAAADCAKKGIQPKELLEKNNLTELQNKLNLQGQSILNKTQGISELTQSATISASSSTVLSEIPFDGEWMPLSTASGQMLPLKAGTKYTFEVLALADEATTLNVSLRTAAKLGNYTPEVVVSEKSFDLKEGEERVIISFDEELEADQYAFLLFQSNASVYVKGSNYRQSGIVSVFNTVNLAVNNHGKQTPPEGLGVEAFEFWIPKRRPEGTNLAMKISPALDGFGTEELVNGFVKPFCTPNAWVANISEDTPELRYTWEEEKEIEGLTLFFDTDYDHPMESVLMGHPEDVVPFCVRNFEVLDEKGNSLYKEEGGFQTMRNIKFATATKTKQLVIKFKKEHENVPVSLFQVEPHFVGA